MFFLKTGWCTTYKQKRLISDEKRLLSMWS